MKKTLLFLVIAVLIAEISLSQPVACPGACRDFGGNPSEENYLRFQESGNPTFEDFNKLSQENQKKMFNKLDLSRTNNMQIAEKYFGKTPDNILGHQEKFR